MTQSELETAFQKKLSMLRENQMCFETQWFDDLGTNTAVPYTFESDR